jgi:hypothetical protein
MTLLVRCSFGHSRMTATLVGPPGCRVRPADGFRREALYCRNRTLKSVNRYVSTVYLATVNTCQGCPRCTFKFRDAFAFEEPQTPQTPQTLAPLLSGRAQIPRRGGDPSGVEPSGRQSPTRKLGRRDFRHGRHGKNSARRSGVARALEASQLPGISARCVLRGRNVRNASRHAIQHPSHKLRRCMSRRWANEEDIAVHSRIPGKMWASLSRHWDLMRTPA